MTGNRLTTVQYLPVIFLAALDIFQSRVARKITGRHPRQRKDGSWIYLSLAGIMKETGMVGIRNSILQRQNTVAQFIATRPILDLCEQATRRPGVRMSWRWWKQTGIDLKGSQDKAAAAAAETEANLESEDEPEEAAGGRGEEESQGVSGSSGVEWSRA